MVRRKDKENSEDPTQVYNVTSYEQSAVITAGIVNIGTDPEVEAKVLAQNEAEDDRYVCRFHVKIARASAGTGL